MPAFLEKKLKSEYGSQSSVPYKVMNSIGAMNGNKQTPKGAAMQAKHVSDVLRHNAPKGDTSGKRSYPGLIHKSK
jgi:hypothetical protein